MRAWLMRVALRCVPRSWRTSVRQDLEDECGDAAEPSWRLAWRMAAIGMSLRWAFTFDGLGADGRDVIRSLVRSPGFSLAAVLTMTVGVAANVVVFSVVDRLLFRPLPYAEPERLVQIHQLTLHGSVDTLVLPGVIAAELERRTAALDGIAWADGYAMLTPPAPGDNPIAIAPVTFNAPRVLGLKPILGRDFIADDARTRGPLAVLLTAETWRARFGGRSDVIGLSWGRQPAYRIVGVLPPGFLLPSSRFIEHVDAIAAVDPRRADTRGLLIVAPFARLKPGVPLAVAQAEVDALLRDAEWSRTHLLEAQATRPVSATVQPLRDGLAMLVKPYLWLISGGVWILLAAACANLSTLLVVRSRAREYGAAIKAAMGASAGRLVRHAVLESVVLCAVGGTAALLACAAVHAWLVSVVPSSLRAFAEPPLDRRVMVIAVLAMGAAALVASVPSAMRVMRTNVMDVFRRTASRTTTAHRGGSWLLAAEAAFGVVVIVGAMMTVPGFMALLLRSPGFVPSDLYVVTVNHGASMTRNGEEHRVDASARLARMRTIRESLASVPHVRQVAVALQVPFGGYAAPSDFWRQYGLTGNQWAVSDGYFQTAGTPIVAGREFQESDVVAQAPVVIVSESGARAIWPNTPPVDVIGRSMQIGTSTRTVVGISRDVRAVPGEPAVPDLFVPITAPDAAETQTGWPAIVRMDAGSVPDGAVATSRLGDAFGQRASAPITSVAALMAPYLDRPRFLAVLFGSLAFAALGLALVGLYAVANLESLQRRFELGVRVALGASGHDVGARVLRKIVQPVVVGTVVGLTAVWWVSTAFQSKVAEISTGGTHAYSVAAALMIGTAVAAGWLPARRAARVDPAIVLREP